MEGVIQWVKSIVYYLLLISLVSGLLPDGKYERYVRLFSGAVFLLIVISPIVGGFNLEEKLARAYERIRFEQDTGEFEEKLWGIEDAQISQVVRQYEEAVSRDIRAMAAADGLLCREATVKIGDREGTKEFGRITGIELVLEKREGDGGFSQGVQVLDGEDEAVIVIQNQPEAIVPVKIQVEEALAGQNGHPDPAKSSNTGERENDRRETARAENDKTEKGGTERGDSHPAENRQEELYGFQRKVAEYYGMEEKNIRITWKNEERELDSFAVRGTNPDDYGGSR